MTLNLSTLYGNVGPANSDIATAVAGAVPTISAINTSVSTYASGFGNTYTLLTSGTMSGATSYTYSWSGTYKKIVMNFLGVYTGTNGGTPAFRFNGDSGNNYSWGDNYGSGSGYQNPSNMIASNLSIWNSSAEKVFITMTIDNPNSTTPKAVQFQGEGGNSYAFVIGVGSYQNSSALSSVTFFDPSSNNPLYGSAYVYGVN